MTERKANARTNESHTSRMTRGHVFLRQEDVDLLSLYSKHHHKKIPFIIQELVQSVIDRFENASLEEQKRQLKEYTEQVLSKSVTVTNALEDSKPPPYIKIDWVLPKTLMSRLSNIAAQGKFDRDTLMSCILSNAIDMKNNS